MNLDNIYIVLVEPQGEINVGSVCRAMMNFGFKNLRIVNPTADIESLETKKMALKASVILDNATVYDDLAGALSDCNITIGTTTRHGKYRNDFMHPEEASDFVRKNVDNNKIALIFGREDFGLSTEDLGLCNHFITIPTDKEFSSINLSHAVSLILYEVKKRYSDDNSESNENMVYAENSEIEKLFSHMRKSLVDIEFLDKSNPDHILMAFRKIFGRAGLNDRDVNILHGLFSRIDWVENERQKLIKKSS